MKYVKVKNKCSLGKRGAEIQMHDHMAEEWVKTGLVEIIDEPKTMVPLVVRPRVSNKAMSAAE